jgi:hypothetical protein
LSALEKGARLPVMIGVDPHKASHTAAALDKHGHLLGQQPIPATLDGYQTLRAWAAGWPDRCWAVEGAHGIGRALARRLVGDGEQVVDVPAKLAARVRVLSVGHGRKSDPDDAVSVAVAARNAAGLRQVGVEDLATVLHLLTKRREDLVATRTQSRAAPAATFRQARRRAAGRGHAHRPAGSYPLAAGHRTRRRRPPPGAANRRRGGAHQDCGRPVQH